MSDAELVAPHFDARFYLALYADVRNAGIDPLAHYLDCGWRERRDPSPLFSTADYLLLYPDVEAAGINPFVHYVTHGQREGRLPRDPGGFRSAYLREHPWLPAVDATAGDAPADDAAELAAALRGLNRTVGRLFVTISHDNFLECVGGVQSSIAREAAAFERRGWDHVHLSPARPTLFTSEGRHDAVVGVIVNGGLAGRFSSVDVAAALRHARVSEFASRLVAVHSLLGHDVDAIIDILSAAGVRRGFFWIHDFGSVCASHTLLRNDVEFCGAPPPASAACSVCRYGPLRAAQRRHHARLFSHLDLAPVAPSPEAARIWTDAGALTPRPVLVHPHCTIDDEPSARPVVTAANDAPLRIAFLGLPRQLKGWPVFRALVVAHAADPRYAFYHLGLDTEPALPVTSVRVASSPTDLLPMRDAVVAHEIDVALIWPLWPETFSLVTYEAIAGGAAIVTWRGSGHIAGAAARRSDALVLDNETQLADAFAAGTLHRFQRSRRQTPPVALTFGALTADLVPEASS